MNKKLLSGRFLFTVVTALVFAYGTVSELISNEQLVAIIMLVVSFYFTKRKEDQDV